MQPVNCPANYNKQPLHTQASQRQMFQIAAHRTTAEDLRNNRNYTENAKNSSHKKGAFQAFKL